MLKFKLEDFPSPSSAELSPLSQKNMLLLWKGEVSSTEKGLRTPYNFSIRIPSGSLKLSGKPSFLQSSLLKI
jgi:hypothetical protein